MTDDDLWQRLLARSEVVGDCRVWTGPERGSGYGGISHHGVAYYCHRLSWSLHHRRPIPPGHVIHHICCNRRCFEPRHLAAVTYRENTLAMIAAGRRVHWRAPYLSLPDQDYPIGALCEVPCLPTQPEERTTDG
jgi:hypothetical protein